MENKKRTTVLNTIIQHSDRYDFVRKVAAYTREWKAGDDRGRILRLCGEWKCSAVESTHPHYIHHSKEWDEIPGVKSSRNWREIAKDIDAL